MLYLFMVANKAARHMHTDKLFEVFNFLHFCGTWQEKKHTF